MIANEVPTVRIAKPKRRPIQLRYICPVENREIRVSTGTHDATEAERQRRELEARLVLGIDRPKRNTIETGPRMRWEDFREQYRTVQLMTIRDTSAADAESRLDIAERILRPRVLSDVANSEALHKLQAAFLAGAEGQNGRPRSPYTVKGYMGAVLAAVNWACMQGWLEAMPVIRKIKVAKLRAAKGRPISEVEFHAMLEQTPEIVGDTGADSWRYLLRGLWESALRLEEIMHVGWDLPNTIAPEWSTDRLPVLRIPHELQKNATEEAIPLLPGFEAMLLETPEAVRTGWAFDPVSLRTKSRRRVRHRRLAANWIGRTISRIGEAAGVVVSPGNKKTGKPQKFASAHDLRRSCADRLEYAGVPPSIIMRVMRHESWETTRRHYATGSVEKDGRALRQHLGAETDVYPENLGTLSGLANDAIDVNPFVAKRAR